MKNCPWAKLTIPWTEKMMVNPTAIVAYTIPTDAPFWA
jgi:hypothetical protein